MSRKRGNGEGSIYIHKRNGRKVGYRGAYTVHAAAGPKRRYVTGKDRDEVRAKLTRAMADRDGGFVYDSKNMSVEEYLGRWLTDSVRDTVRESTYASYRRMVGNHLVPGVGRLKLAKLKPGDLRRLYREKLNSGLSTRTVRYVHTIVKKALKDAVRMEAIPRNPADAVDPPKLRQEEMHPLSANQARALLRTAATSGNRLEALFVVAVHTGMRPGELLALRWEDVRFEGTPAMLEVRRSLSASQFTATKTGKGRRVALSRGATEALRAHRKRQLEEGMEKAGLWKDHGLVFPSRNGTPLEHHNVVRSFKRLLRRAGLPKTFRLYDLRHTAATLLLSRNVHPKYVAEMLGHSSIAITLDKYSHVIEGMDGGTGSAMDEILS